MTSEQVKTLGLFVETIPGQNMDGLLAEYKWGTEDIIINTLFVP